MSCYYIIFSYISVLRRLLLIRFISDFSWKIFKRGLAIRMSWYALSKKNCCREGVSFLGLILSHKNNYFTNYADAVTPYLIGNNLEEVACELKIITQKLFTWFPQNELKVNLSKCHKK